MVGCRVGAKNTLVKNYLALAESLGARVEPLRTVVDVVPLDPRDPSAGYRVTTERTGAWLRKDRRSDDGPRRWCSPPARGAPSACCTGCAPRAGCPTCRRASAC